MHLHPLPQRPLTAVLVGLLVAVGAAGCGTAADPNAAEVAAVVDGNTLELLQGGKPVTVHLLGIDAPTAQDCLSAESAAALAKLLPVKSAIRLDHGTDEGVAAVYAQDVLVNAELVRLGLGLATDSAGSIADEVTKAQQEAMDDEAGLFGTEADCTVPAQVAALESAGSDAADAAGALVVGVGLDEIDRHGAAVAAVAASGVALAALLEGDASTRYPSSLVATLRDRTTAVNDRLVSATAGIAQVRVAEGERVEAERVAAEAAAQAAAAEAARVAQAAADAEAARVAAAAKAAAKKATTSKAPAAEAPASGGSVYYKNCDAVRAAGAAPLRSDQPGYSKKLDRDGDGVACEK